MVEDFLVVRIEIENPLRMIKNGSTIEAMGVAAPRRPK
jgi:hypothetical protein